MKRLGGKLKKKLDESRHNRRRRRRQKQQRHPSSWMGTVLSILGASILAINSSIHQTRSLENIIGKIMMIEESFNNHTIYDIPNPQSKSKKNISLLEGMKDDLKLGMMHIGKTGGTTIDSSVLEVG